MITDTLLGKKPIIYPVLGIKACHNTHSWGKVGRCQCIRTQFIPIPLVIHDTILFLDIISGIQKPLDTLFWGNTYTTSLKSLALYHTCQVSHIWRDYHAFFPQHAFTHTKLVSKHFSRILLKLDLISMQL